MHFEVEFPSTVGLCVSYTGAFLIKMLLYDAYIVQFCEEETCVFALLHKESIFLSGRLLQLFKWNLMHLKDKVKH